MAHIVAATLSDAQIIHELAEQIWYPTYQHILSQEQIAFMLGKSYTVAAIQEAMQSETTFHLLLEEGMAVGFIAIASRASLLRIEKLYLQPHTQGKGYGKLMIQFAVEVAQKQGLEALELNVNRGNQAYQFYLKQGFEVIETVDIPYYQYILDDYVMRKPLFP